MRKVPRKNIPYLIVGSGRLARHLAQYFKLLNISFLSWDRSNKDPLFTYFQNVDKVLLAVSDGSIEKLAFSISNKTVIHFSGALRIPELESAHPLYTFGYDLYDLEVYKTIPFVTEKGKRPFKELFPELNNQSFQIKSKDKELYHAWSSMAGNFSSLLITEYIKILKKLGLPSNISKPYLLQVVVNSVQTDKALTGPIQRGDKKTISKHLEVIEEDFISIYKSFISLVLKRYS